MTMSYRPAELPSVCFEPAELSGVGLFIALAGPSRSGKTKTALELARGIAGPAGKIACIDTEGRRMTHYKNDYLNTAGEPFNVYNMPSPFTGLRFLEAARMAQASGHDACVIDSFSLEWSGTGGVLAEHALAMGEAEQSIRRANDASERPEPEWKIEQKIRRRSDACWNRVKGPGSSHRDMMDGFIQLTMPVIFCLRANPVAPHLLKKGMEEGWKVDQDKRFLFEWTVGLCLHPDTPGMPRFDMFDAKNDPLWKVQEQHRHLFPEGKFITTAAGAALQAWRNSDAARSSVGATLDTRKANSPEDIAAGIVEAVKAAASQEQLDGVLDEEKISRQISWLKDKRPDLAKEVTAAIKEAIERVNEVPQ